MKKLMVGEKKLFHDPKALFLTADNYFSGNSAVEYISKEGFGCCFTNRRDRLPKEIPSQYLQKEKTDSSERSRAARFQSPIVVTKQVDEDTTVQLVTFQSTSSCNIMCINALNTCELYADTKERGRGKQKRRWAIEMNEGRRLYLSTYNQIDRIDHLIQSCRMGYRSWKYWHSGMTHGKAMVVVVAYDMYLECCEGRLRNGIWRVNEKHIVSFHQFRQKLAIQMLHYDARDRNYPGDERFRTCSQEHSSRRRGYSSSVATGTSGSSSSSNQGASGRFRSASSALTTEAFLAYEDRCCEDLTKLKEHLSSLKSISSGSGRICIVCGKTCRHRCEKCGLNMHWPAQKEQGRKYGCFFDYHDTTMLGLCRSDFDMLKPAAAGGSSSSSRRQKDWNWPSEDETSAHADKVRRLMAPPQLPQQYSTLPGGDNMQL